MNEWHTHYKAAKAVGGSMVVTDIKNITNAVYGRPTERMKWPKKKPNIFMRAYGEANLGLEMFMCVDVCALCLLFQSFGGSCHI